MRKIFFEKPVLFLVFAFIFIPCMILAADEGITSSTELSLQISTRPEAKLSLTQSFVFPFLQGSGPLTSGNNIRTDISAEVSPVSVAGIGEIIWTPAAFLEIDLGGRIGSGWNMPLGNGIGFNVPVGAWAGSPRKSEITGEPFDGFQWSVWAGGALQFDMAAVIPGDWNHVIVRVYNQLKFSAYSSAVSGDSWVLENDDAENMNGWVLYSSAVLGYRMPLSPVLDFVGLMAEAEYNLYEYPGKDYWGGDLPKWTFSTMFNFSITPNFSAALIAQMRTRRNHGSSDLDNNDEYWYQDLPINNDNGNLRLVFYRVAAIFTYTF